MSKATTGGWGRASIVGLALVALLVVGTWAYSLWIYRPQFNAERQKVAFTFGPYPSDLYSSWLPARELLFHGRDPYGPDITREIQLGFYGRVLAPDDEVRATLAFIYPPSMIVLFAPLALLPFEWVSTLFALTVPLLCMIVAVGSMAAAGWRPARPSWLALLALAASTIPATYLYYLQQPTLWVAVLLAGTVLALVRGGRGEPAPSPPLTTAHLNWWYIGAGLLFALTTVKPQVALGPGVWLGLWVLGDWRRRQGLAWGVGIGGALLGAFSFALVPNWVGEWRAALGDYVGYATGLPPLGLLPFTPPAAIAWLQGALVVAALVGGWAVRRAAPGTPAWAWAWGVAGLVGLHLIPSWVPYNHILLLPGAIALALAWATPGTGRAARLLYGGVLAFLVLPQALATAITGLWLAAGGLNGAAGAGRMAELWPLAWAPGLFTPLLLIPPLAVLGWQTIRRAAPGRQPREAQLETVEVRP